MLDEQKYYKTIQDYLGATAFKMIIIMSIYIIATLILSKTYINIVNEKYRIFVYAIIFIIMLIHEYIINAKSQKEYQDAIIKYAIYKELQNIKNKSQNTL